MNSETHKQSLIKRLMKVEQPIILNELEEVLQRAEMEARAIESIKDAEKGNVISLDEFAKSNQAWLKEQRTR
ncbi:MAG: hypothetical protein ACI9DK_001880 [Vicingaceae bacterium]|jgi:hypothetical protein